MFCSSCGSVVQGGAVFCAVCGNRIGNFTSAMAVNMQPASQIMQFSCGGCGSSLSITSDAEIVACGLCGTQLRNPIFKGHSAIPVEQGGTILTYFNSADASYKEAVITILETNQKYSVAHGVSGKINLKPGKYNITVTIANKTYHYDIYLRSVDTVMVINMSRTFMRNLVDIKYQNGIICNVFEIFEEKNAQIAYTKLLALGFTYVQLNPIKGRRSQRGKISTVLIDGERYENFREDANNVSPETKFMINYFV